MKNSTIGSIDNFEEFFNNTKNECLTFIENGEKQEDLPNEFEILPRDDWISISDHLPLVFKFDEKSL